MKAGLAGLLPGIGLRQLCTPVILEYLDPNDRVPGPGFISGHGTPMLSDQALKQGRLEDALACAGDEGRSKLR